MFYAIAFNSLTSEYLAKKNILSDAAKHKLNGRMKRRKIENLNGYYKNVFGIGGGGGEKLCDKLNLELSES